MKAIVLSGGGSKGAYQVGVWKALRKLDIKYDIITGTSVGALNGAFMVQNSFRSCINIWKTMSMKKVFGKDVKANSTFDLYKVYAKEFINENGIEPKGLESLINRYLNTKKFYNSRINFGLITYNITNKKPLILTKDKIPKNELKDYLIASASCYPAFKPREIEEKKYIDGGYYDYMPINLAVELGATEAIVVDCNAPGRRKRTIKNIPITKISPNNTLASFLEFDKDLAIKNMKYGYNDTMKVFGKYVGKKYTFTNNTIPKLKIKYQDTFIHLFKEVINSKNALLAINKILKMENVEDNIDDKVLLKAMEHIGKKYNLDDSRIYTLKSFNKLLLKKFNSKIKSKNKTKDIEMYYLLRKQNYSKVKKIALQNPLTFLGVLYIYTILEN